MLISKTPYRVSLFGGGTDFPAWYREHGGAVVAGAIDKFCYLTLRDLPPFFDHEHRIVYSQIETVSSIDQIKHPAVRGAFERYGVASGLELHHDGDLPAKSGIGSSSAFTVGLIAALRGHFGKTLSRYDLAREAIEFEQDVLGESVGSQDQVSCAFGGFNLVTFPPEGPFTVSALPARTADDRRLSDGLVLIFTGTARRSSDVSAEFLRRIDDNAPILRRTREMVDEFLKLLAAERDDFFANLGGLFSESWRLKATANPYASNHSLEEIHDALRRRGASGAKISGAGGGGFVLAAVEPDRRDEFVRDVRQLNGMVVVPFDFCDEGARLIVG